jgi:hypothetical protein
MNENQPSPDLAANLLVVSGTDRLAIPASAGGGLHADNAAAAVDPEVDADAGLRQGFDDPVGGAQSTFRTALMALSHPGSVLRLNPQATRGGTAPGLSIAMSALLLTLVDSDTPVWLPAGPYRVRPRRPGISRSIDHRAARS